jgi:hypothetical protein
MEQGCVIYEFGEKYGSELLSGTVCWSGKRAGLEADLSPQFLMSYNFLSLSD